MAQVKGFRYSGGKSLSISKERGLYAEVCSREFNNISWTADFYKRFKNSCLTNHAQVRNDRRIFHDPALTFAK